MKRVSWLARLTALVWLAWLGLVGLMDGMLRLGVTLQLSADDYSLVHKDSVNRMGKTWGGDTVYDSQDGVPLLKSARIKGHWDDGSTADIVLSVTDRSFEPIPDDEFAPRRLLDGAPVHHIAAKPGPSEVSEILTCSRCLSAWGWSPSRQVPASSPGRGLGGSSPVASITNRM